MIKKTRSALLPPTGGILVTRRLSVRAPEVMKRMGFASLVGAAVCRFVRADVFMGARLGQKKAQPTRPLLVFLSAVTEEKHP